jgi:hypothetical protein
MLIRSAYESPETKLILYDLKEKKEKKKEDIVQHFLG